MINTIKKILTIAIIGITIAGIAHASYPQYWNFNDDLICRTAGTCDITGAGTITTDNLTVSNSFLLQGTVGVGGIDLNGEALYLDPDAGMYLQAAVNDNLGIMGGNVGIGTTSPGAKLDIKTIVSGGTVSGIRLEASDDSNYLAGLYEDSADTGSAVLDLRKDNVGTSVLLKANGDSYFNGGDVGIGTAGPDRKFEVLDATNPQLRLTYTDDTVYADMELDSDGDLYITPTGGDIAFGDGEAGDSVLDFYASSNRIWTMGLDDSDSDKFKISTSFDFSSGEQMSISTDGQVSFGDGLVGDSVIDLYATTTRTWTFGLDDSDSDSFKISTSSDFASGNALTILTGGNVGIGTTGPDEKLDVLSTTTQLRLTYTDGSVYAGFRVDSSGNLEISPTGKKTTIDNILKIQPQATAPATCSIGEIFIKSNGGYCVCSVIDTWENLSANGSCE